MSDFSRLEGMIAKLRRRERAPGEKRAIKSANGDRLLTLLLTEIDETILPRRLTLETSAGQSLHLGVANRRLQGLLAPAAQGEELAGKPLVDPDEAWVKSFREALGAFFGDGGEFTITATRLGDDDMGSDAGLSAEVLAKAWDVSAPGQAATDPGEVIASFLDRLGEDRSAWLKIAGEEVVDQGGDEASLNQLSDGAAVFMDAYLNRRGQIGIDEGGSHGVSVAFAGGAMFFADCGSHAAVVLVPSEALGRVAASWQAAVA